MNPVFADTFYFLALLNPRDDAHGRAVAFARQVTSLVTTAWVMTELADGMADPPNRSQCVAFWSQLAARPDATIVPADQALLEEGLRLYAGRPDKGWSLTDCLSFVVMRDRAITDALTADHHFEQAGFRALLR